MELMELLYIQPIVVTDISHVGHMTILKPSPFVDANVFEMCL